MRRLLDRDQIAARLGVAPAWLKRHLGRLYRQGFPRPLPLPAVERWDPAALNHWLDRLRAPVAGGVVQPLLGTLGNAANDRDAAVEEADPLAAILDRRATAIAERR